MMLNQRHPQLLATLFALTISLLPVSSNGAASYDGFRWFLVEMSIFTNDYPEYRNAELWSTERLQLAYPGRVRDFSRLSDFFMVADFEQRAFGGFTDQEPGFAQTYSSVNDQPSEVPPAPEVGPFAARPPGDLRLPDLERDPYFLLPPTLSDFRTTNTRLERSAEHRLLFTGLWRQPVVQPEDATSLIVRGGRQYGEHYELEGSITIRFNQNEDRVVIDTDLWLTEFLAPGTGDPEWVLPEVPTAVSTVNPTTTTFGIGRIVQMRQSRPMRSNEFHYLDHPALGVVISVQPYDLPPPVVLQAPAADVSPDPDSL